MYCHFFTLFLLYGGKYLEKVNMFLGEEEDWRRKMRKMFGEGEYFLWRRRRMEGENQENAWKRKMSPTREGRAGEEGTLEGRDEQFRDSSGDQRSLTLASRLF